MATSKNTGLTLTLVFFVIATLVSCVLAIIMYQDNQDRLAQQRNDKQEALTNKQLASTALQDIEVLKELLGKPGLESIGDPNSEPQDDTVYWAVVADMEAFGGVDKEPTVMATLQKMHTQIAELSQHLAEKEKSFDDLQEKYTLLDQTQNQIHAQLDEARAMAEKAKQENLETHQTELNAKDTTIQSKEDELNKLAGDHDELARDFEEHKTETAERMKNQKNLIRDLGERIANIQKFDFDVEDGQIVWTSNDKKTVWINLGSSDQLPLNMSFSVYKKQNTGVARTEEDIKGAIEITKILEPHLAEAQVKNNVIFTPITKGDPIFTPLWNPGSSEKMAIVGFIDLDQDGRDDRQRLRDIIAASGATVVAEILDDGTTIPADADFSKLITSDVKYVIQGEMPNPSSTSVPDELNQIKEVLSQFKDMREAALDNGVRLMELSKFLNFVGYKVERRLFRPGDDVTYNLKNGSRSASVDETLKRLGSRSQRTGQNAGVYDRTRSLRKRFSTGQTSKKYNGN